MLSFGSGPLVLAAMRRQIPDHERPFRLPGGDVIPFLAFYSLEPDRLLGRLGHRTGSCSSPSLHRLRAARRLPADRTRPCPAARPGRPARPGRCPWLGGLSLISYLGDYDGGRGWIGLGWGFVVNLALAAIVYLLALRVRLPVARVEEHIREAETESREEEAELGKAL